MLAANLFGGDSWRGHKTDVWLNFGRLSENQSHRLTDTVFDVNWLTLPKATHAAVHN